MRREREGRGYRNEGQPGGEYVRMRNRVLENAHEETGYALHGRWSSPRGGQVHPARA